MNDLIKQARELCKGATPGPWYWDAIDAHKCICLESARWKVMDFARYGMNGAAPRFLVDGIMERADTLLQSIPGKEHHRGFNNYIDHPDAAFIAASRTLVPALADALEKAQGEIERLTACAEAAETERDAVIEDLEWLAITAVDSLKCNICKYNPDDTGCELDGSQFDDDGECHFTYWRRGVQQEQEEEMK